MIETTLAENLAMIEDSVAYLKRAGKELVYDAEHFFDGWKANREYALETLRAAAAAAPTSWCCATPTAARCRGRSRRSSPRSRGLLATRLGIHTHDDAGCGVANTLAAVRAGAVMVQGTINGYGERVSNANLTTIVPDLQLKMGRRCVAPERLRELAELSRYVAEVANIPHDDYFPYVGKSAFAHKGGIHVAAVLKCPESYQHIDPGAVGNEMRTVVSELSGRGNILHLAERGNVEADPSRAREVLERVKQLESKGYTFEAAEASVEMMLRRTHAEYRAPFKLVDFMVVVEHREGRGLFAEATVKVEVEGRVMHTAAEGNGPVNALSTRAAQGARRQPSRDPRRPSHRLQGPHPRLRRGHRRHHPRADRLPEGHAVVDHRRRLGQHHRGELGGAGGRPRVRDRARAGRVGQLGRDRRRAARRRHLGAARPEQRRSPQHIRWRLILSMIVCLRWTTWEDGSPATPSSSSRRCSGAARPSRRRSTGATCWSRP